MRNKAQIPRVASRGFTLIEAVVALGILMVALAGTLTLIIAAVNLSLNARNTTTANAYMQQRLTDAVSIICTGCNPTLDPTGLDTDGNTNNDVTLDVDGNESNGVNVHPAKRYTDDDNINNVIFTSKIYVDESYPSVPDQNGTLIIGPGGDPVAAAIDSVNFIKVISKVDWNYKGIDYSDSTVQFVRRDQ